MKNGIIRILCVLLILSLMAGITLTGCKSETETSGSEASSISAPATTIKYYTWRAEDTEVFNTLIAKFEAENPGIKVQLEIQKDAAIMTQTVQANIDSGENLDVFDMQPAVTYSEYVKEGYLADQSDLPYMDTYMDKVKNLTAVNGRNYGFCTGVNIIAFFYNKDIFTECGVEVPNTWDEFTAGMQKMKAKGYGGISYLGATVGTMFLANYFIGEELGPSAIHELSQGLDSGNIVGLKDNVGFVDALKTCQTIVKDGYLYDNAESIQFEQSYTLFATKKSPVMMMGSWAIGEAAAKFPGINYGIMGIPSPYKNDPSYVYPAPAMITVVAANSKNLEASKKFVDFLATPENAKTYLNSSKFLPTVTGIVPDYLADQDFLKTIIADGLELPPIDNLVNSVMWSGAWADLWNNVMWKGNDVNSELDKFNTAIKNADIQKNGKKG